VLSRERAGFDKSPPLWGARRAQFDDTTACRHHDRQGRRRQRLAGHGLFQAAELFGTLAFNGNRSSGELPPGAPPGARIGCSLPHLAVSRARPTAAGSDALLMQRAIQPPVAEVGSAPAGDRVVAIGAVRPCLA
jgi:hypothetical protein